MYIHAHIQYIYIYMYRVAEVGDDTCAGGSRTAGKAESLDCAL